MEILPPINQRVKDLINYYSNGVVRVFADKLESISQQTLNRLFNIDTRTKKYPVPTTDILVAITNMFVDVNPRWLLNGNGEMLLPPNKSGSENTHTPTQNQSLGMPSDKKTTNNAPATSAIFAPPTAPATLNLGMPKVVAINENNDDLVSLVNTKAAAGYLNGFADMEYIENLPTIRLPNLKGGSHRAFEVKGHSMQPTIHNGAISVGRWVENLSDIRDRRIYIIVSKSEGIVIKRVLNRINDSGRLILLSDNQNKREYPNILLEPEDVQELWYLRGSFLFEFPEPGEINNRISDLEAAFTIMQDEFKKLSKRS
ncbi:S24 family peptidase [Pedobacter sp. PAMC26386]|nr:S24 family peptidase [Pedobacter sp. PAMC26386]